MPNQGKGTYTPGLGFFVGGNLQGKHLRKEWVLQFQDKLFYIADDEEPTADIDKALVILGGKEAAAEAKIVYEQWGEPVRAIRKPVG
jgi:hypothetical protein